MRVTVVWSLALAGPVIQWAADHRRRHAFADREGDAPFAGASALAWHPSAQTRPATGDGVMVQRERPGLASCPASLTRPLA
jgi:hypothetical protein